MPVIDLPAEDMNLLLRVDQEIDRIELDIEVAKERLKELKEDMKDAQNRRKRLSRELRGNLPLFARPDADDASTATRATLNDEILAGVREAEAKKAG